MRRLTSFAKFRALYGWLIRNREFQARRPRLATLTRLELGCGTNVDPEFINLDYNWRPGVDLCWDLAARLPFPNGRFSAIYSEHCIEHLPVSMIAPVFAECHRVLRSGGMFRIAVPDAELYLRAYCRVLAGAPRAELPYSEADTLHGIYSPVVSVNRIFREHGHQYMYDFDCLKQLLEVSGFEDVRRCNFRDSADPTLARDSEMRRKESLYLECQRP